MYSLYRWLAQILACIALLVPATAATLLDSSQRTIARSLDGRTILDAQGRTLGTVAADGAAADNLGRRRCQARADGWIVSDNGTSIGRWRQSGESLEIMTANGTSRGRIRADGWIYDSGGRSLGRFQSNPMPGTAQVAWIVCLSSLLP